MNSQSTHRAAVNLANVCLIAIGRYKVLPSRELVIERGDLIQPIDNPFVGHRGCVATSSFRFFAEERGSTRNRGVR